MITRRKLAVYTRYRGDLDGFVRSATQGEEREISSEDWIEIDDLLGNLVLILGGHASELFADQVRTTLATRVSDDDTRAILRTMAEKSAEQP